MSERTGLRREARHRPGLAVTAAASLVALILTAIPAAAAPSETIDATITVEGPCITLPTTSINFGSVGFSTTTGNIQKSAAAFVVTPCSAQTQDLYASASNAAGTGSGAWTLTPVGGSLLCSIGIDNFGTALTPSGGSQTELTTVNTLVKAGVLLPVSMGPTVLMPCSGSSGVGETMTFTYTVTAVLP